MQLQCQISAETLNLFQYLYIQTRCNNEIIYLVYGYGDKSPSCTIPTSALISVCIRGVSLLIQLISVRFALKEEPLDN